MPAAFAITGKVKSALPPSERLVGDTVPVPSVTEKTTGVAVGLGVAVGDGVVELPAEGAAVADAFGVAVGVLGLLGLVELPGVGDVEV